ncbi:hypothetical protein ACJX0J_014100, partial [Zea mays]
VSCPPSDPTKASPGPHPKGDDEIKKMVEAIMDEVLQWSSAPEKEGDRHRTVYNDYPVAHRTVRSTTTAGEVQSEINGGQERPINEIQISRDG